MSGRVPARRGPPSQPPPAGASGFRPPGAGVRSLVAGLLATLVGVSACSGARSDEQRLSEELGRARATLGVGRQAADSSSTARVTGTRRLEVLLPPTPLRGAGALACDGDRVLVAEPLADRLSTVRADGSVSRFAGPSGFRRPTDFAFGPGGTLYVASEEPGGLWRRDPSGAWRRLSAAVADATGVAVAPTGEVYVSECAQGGRVLRLDPDDGHPIDVLADGLGCPGRLAIDDSGALIVPLRERGEVIALEPRTRERAVWASGLDVPSAIGRTPDGQLVVLESGTGRIRSLARDPARADPGAVVRTLLPGLGDLVVCGETVVVSNEATGGLVAFKPWPDAMRTLVPDGLVAPSGLAFDGPDLIVSDRASLKRIRNDGLELLLVAGTRGLPSPAGLAGGLPGFVWVAAPEAGELLQVDLGRREATRIVSGLDWPTSVLRTPAGDLVVAETGAGRVVRLGLGAVPYTLASGLMSPVGLASRGERVLTAEPSGGRVLSLREEGAPTIMASGLSEPAGLATAPRQPLYVAEANRGALLARSSDGTERRVAEGLALDTGATERPLPVPVVIAPDGAVVIASPGDGSVLRISPN